MLKRALIAAVLLATAGCSPDAPPAPPAVVMPAPPVPPPAFPQYGAALVWTGVAAGEPAWVETPELSALRAAAGPSDPLAWIEAGDAARAAEAWRESEPLHAAVAYALAGEPARAVEIYDRLLVAGESAELLGARAAARVRLGETDAAFRDFARSLELDPSSLDARLGRAWVWRTLGAAQIRAGGHARLSLQEALAECDAAIERHAGSAAAYVARGLAYAELGAERRRIGESAVGEERAAFADFDRAVEIDASPAAFCGRGRIRLAGADYAGAVTDFDRGLPAALPYRATALRLWAPTSDDPASALARSIDDYSTAIDRRLSLVESHVGRGLARRLLGQHLQERDEDGRPHYRGAVEDFTAALELSPLLAEAHEHRGVARQMLAVAEVIAGEASEHLFESALADFERCIEFDPDRFAPLANAAVVAAILRKWEAARRHSEAALRIDPLNADLRKINEDAAKRLAD